MTSEEQKPQIFSVRKVILAALLHHSYLQYT